jgi:hypothetical protein
MKPHHAKIWIAKFMSIMDEKLGKERVDAVCAEHSKGDPLEAIKALSRELGQEASGEVSFLLMMHMAENITADELIQSVEAGDGMCVVDVADVKAKAASGQFVYFTGYSMRHGLAMAMSEIEHGLFPPAEKSNDLFEYYMAKLPPTKDGIPMTVFGVPKEYEAQVRGILDSNGLKIQEDGFSMMVLGGGSEIGHQFKCAGTNIFPLENVSNHKCYVSGKAASDEDAERTKAEMDFRHIQNTLKEKEQDAKEEKVKEGDQEPAKAAQESQDL